MLETSLDYIILGIENTRFPFDISEEKKELALKILKGIVYTDQTEHTARRFSA